MTSATQRTSWPRAALLRLSVPLLLPATGCAPPLTMTMLDQTDAYHRLNRSALGEDRLSETTLIALRRHNLAEAFPFYPAETIAALHSQAAGKPEAWGELFALAELSYLTARRSHSPQRYLAAAIYAYAYLFPDGAADRPSPYDPRFREACDLYNLSLSAALAQPGSGGEVMPASGHYALPFGMLEVTLDQDSLSWGGRQLVGFVPTGRLEVTGQNNQHRSAGIGAPMAARVSVLATPLRGFQVAPGLRVPATLLLRIPSPRRQLAGGTLHATLAAYNIFDTGAVTPGDRLVPLEYDQTAARAVSLVETAMWNKETSGFLQGALLEQGNTRLIALEPHRPGRMPVVLVHGTASSPFRWADMVNDLLEDPAIREHFEFWFFSYNTGNPIPKSARLLREALQQAVAALGGAAADPALEHVTLIGHSQGGLLAKMQVIDPGTRMWDMVSTKPIDQLHVQPGTKALLRATLEPRPVREVDRVIFIATLHRGSYLAGFSIAQLAQRLVTLPLAVTKAGAEVLTGNADAMRFDASRFRLGSVYGMTPGSPLIEALAAIPVVPGVRVHSIIPVQTRGPVEQGDDGVVKYASAHLTDAESEKVVLRSGHSTQSNPVTIEEVRRILMLELTAACPGGKCDQGVNAQ